jgi:hypothetical protein
MFANSAGGTSDAHSWKVFPLLRPTVKGEWSSAKVRGVMPCTSRSAGNTPIPKLDIGAVAKAMIASGVACDTP